MCGEAREITMKEQKETFQGDGFVRIYTLQNLPNCTLYIQLVLCQVYFNKLLYLKILKGE